MAEAASEAGLRGLPRSGSRAPCVAHAVCGGPPSCRRKAWAARVLAVREAPQFPQQARSDFRIPQSQTET
eukprot:15430480-Alexandrium_andersonii.AAC.1